MKKRVFSKKRSFFEKNAWQKNLLACGIDEVGRGCLAGPLVVAAAIIPPNTRNLLLKDSKILKPEEMLKAYAWIQKNCLYSTVIMSWKEVDRLNIYQATLKAMKRAYISLLESHKIAPKRLKYVLVDAMPLKLEKSLIWEDLEEEHFPYGESVSPSIAAASIVAKVTRDRLMGKMNALFPYYQLGKNKGYGTGDHKMALGRYGSSIVHRKTFIGGILDEKDTQTTLF